MSIYTTIKQLGAALSAVGLLSSHFDANQLLEGADETDVDYWKAIGEIVSQRPRQISPDNLQRFCKLMQRTPSDLRRHLLTWVVDEPSSTFHRISRLSRQSEFPENIHKLLEYLFYPPRDPDKAFEQALKFIDYIDALTINQLRALVYGLPQVYLRSLSQPENYSLSLTGLIQEKIKTLPIEQKQKIIWNLIKLWAIDNQENVGDADQDFFGKWMDDLVQIDVGNWPQNYNEAVVLYASIRGMVDHSSEFLRWVNENVPGLKIPKRFFVRYPSCNADEVLGSAQTVIGVLVHQAVDEQPSGFNLKDWVERMRELVALQANMGLPHNHGEANIGRRIPVDGILGKLGLTQSLVNWEGEKLAERKCRFLSFRETDLFRENSGWYIKAFFERIGRLPSPLTIASLINLANEHVELFLEGRELPKSQHLLQKFSQAHHLTKKQNEYLIVAWLRDYFLSEENPKIVAVKALLAGLAIYVREEEIDLEHDFIFHGVPVLYETNDVGTKKAVLTTDIKISLSTIKALFKGHYSEQHFPLLAKGLVAALERKHPEISETIAMIMNHISQEEHRKTDSIQHPRSTKHLSSSRVVSINKARLGQAQLRRARLINH